MNCPECGKDQERVRTHYDGCHKHHPECAAWRAGREAGMREAAEVAKRGDITGWAMGGEIRDAFADAILAAIGEGK